MSIDNIFITLVTSLWQSFQSGDQHCQVSVCVVNSFREVTSLTHTHTLAYVHTTNQTNKKRMHTLTERV